MCAKRVLLTGFGPFTNVEINPSWESVTLMNRNEIESKYNIHLYQEKIEVAYEHVDGFVPELWKKHQPDLTIHVGVRDEISGFLIETQATKERYYIPENETCPVDFEQQSDRPDIVTTDLDVDALCEEFNSNPPAEGLTAQKSYDAGKYICEYTYYTSLCYSGCKKTLFVHVPLTGFSFEQIAQGLERVLECCLKQC